MNRLGLIVVAENGRITNDEDIIYDSRKKHLQVDLLATPKRLQLLEVRGTALVSSGADWAPTEILATIAHKLPFIPKCLVYFYVKTNTVTPSTVGGYGRDKLWYAIAAYEDYIYAEADATNVYIKHKLDDSSATIGATSAAPDFLIQAKVMITSNRLNTLDPDA